jgi:hypothetical protein
LGQFFLSALMEKSAVATNWGTRCWFALLTKVKQKKKKISWFYFQNWFQMEDSNVCTEEVYTRVRENVRNFVKSLSYLNYPIGDFMIWIWSWSLHLFYIII